jgi:hypothetical protein
MIAILVLRSQLKRFRMPVERNVTQLSRGGEIDDPQRT